MKRLLVLIKLIFFVVMSNAQQVVEEGKSEDENKFFTKVEVEAVPNRKAWAEHLRKAIQLPDSAIENIPPGTYRVDVQFIVDKHGIIGQVKAKNDPGFGLAKRAVKIISTYSGTWQPASQCGRNVNAYKVQTITFAIPTNSQPNL